MSWSLSIPAQPFESFLKAVEAAQLPEDTYNPPAVVEQWQDQLAGAKAAITAALSHDIFGHEENSQFSASMNGHANHAGAGDDAPGGGYTRSEFVQITINRQPPAE